MKRLFKFITALLPNIIFRALGSLATFTTAYFISFTFDTSTTGLFFYLLALTTVIATLTRMGTETLLLKQFSVSNSEYSFTRLNLLLNSTIISLLITLGCYSGLLIFSESVLNLLGLDAEDKESLFIFFSYTFFLSVITQSAMALQGLKLSKTSVFFLSLLLNSLFIVSILTGLVKADASLFYTFIVLALITAMLAFISILWVTKKENVDFHLNFKGILIASFPFLLVNLCSQINVWSGQIFTGVWSTVEDVAIYNIAQKIAFITTFFLMAVNFLIAPKFSALKSTGDLQELKNVFILSSRMIIIVTLPIVLIMLFAPSLLLKFLGEEYKNSQQLIQILALGQLVNICTGSVGYLLAMTGNEKSLRNSSLIGASLIVLMSVILVPQIGSLGAAIATSSGIALTNALSCIYVYRNLDINLMWVFNIKH